MHFGGHHIVSISAPCVHVYYRTVEGCVTHGLFLSAPDSALLTELPSCRTRSLVILEPDSGADRAAHQHAL